MIEADEQTCELAASIAETTASGPLDAMHLAAAQRAGGPTLTFLRFDLRQAQAARSIGFSVVGA
jgi:predicted nucleic acid-binding protein